MTRKERRAVPTVSCMHCGHVFQWDPDLPMCFTVLCPECNDIPHHAVREMPRDPKEWEQETQGGGVVSTMRYQDGSMHIDDRQQSQPAVRG